MTKMGSKRTEPRKRIKPISDKQKIKNALWNKITNGRCEKLGYICEYCGKRGQRINSEALDWLDGHHIQRRSRGRIDTEENCYICHRVCHSYIEDHNIIVSQGDYWKRKYWL